jgi:homoserine kinase
MDKVELFVNSSAANIGPGYDIWSIGFKEPGLYVVAEKTGKGVAVEYDGGHETPQGMKLGYAGGKALEMFLSVHGITDGLKLSYREKGDYPMGGLGRSGAEAVAAVMGAALAFGIELSPGEVIAHSAASEPEGHADNVAASVNGRFNVVTRSPKDDKIHADRIDVPDSLGIIMAVSSHKKEGGTGAARGNGDRTFSGKDFKGYAQRVSMAPAALRRGEVDTFLEYVSGENFHEMQRAAARRYGDFTDREFTKLKQELFGEHDVVWVASGAGPTMLGLYNKDRHPDAEERMRCISSVVDRCLGNGAIVKLKEMAAAKEGAYGYAAREFNYGGKA